jgi:polar amino acid transport system substrate-binding protein
MLPWNRAFNTALNSKNTLIYSIARTTEREPNFVWIGPVHKTQVNLYKLKSRSDIKIASFNDIKNYRLVLLTGGFIVEKFSNANFIQDKHYRLINSNESRIKMLFADRYDLADFLDLQLVKLLEKTGHTRDELEIVMPLATDEILYLAINKQAKKEIVDKLRSCLGKYNTKAVSG